MTSKVADPFYVKSESFFRVADVFSIKVIWRPYPFIKSRVVPLGPFPEGNIGGQIECDVNERGENRG